MSKNPPTKPANSSNRLGLLRSPLVGMFLKYGLATASVKLTHYRVPE